MTISERISHASPKAKQNLKSVLKAFGLIVLGAVGSKAGDLVFDTAKHKAAELAGSVVTKTELDAAVLAINGETAKQIEGLRADLQMDRTEIQRVRQWVGITSMRLAQTHVACFVGMDPKRKAAANDAMVAAEIYFGPRAAALGDPTEAADETLKSARVPRW